MHAAVTTYDTTDADVLDVIQWAQARAGTEHLYAVALANDDAEQPAGQRRGLTWLVGSDANSGDTGAIRDMEARRANPAVRPAEWAPVGLRRDDGGGL